MLNKFPSPSLCSNQRTEMWKTKADYGDLTSFHPSVDFPNNDGERQLGSEQWASSLIRLDLLINCNRWPAKVAKSEGRRLDDDVSNLVTLKFEVSGFSMAIWRD